MIKKFLCLAILFSCCATIAISPYYSIRSQSENAARELVGAGWNTQINLIDAGDFYGNLSITPEYTRSFRPRRICDCLFGCFACSCYPCGTSCSTCDSSCSSCCYPCGTSCGTCCDDDCCRINISGSQVADRGCCDWLADYFGLPTDYQSYVTFSPRIENFLVDFNLYFGMDRWCEGLYIRLHAPVVCTRWDLNMCECICDCGSTDHLPGYFNETLSLSATQTLGIARSNLVSSFASFISGCGTINADDITFNRLYHAKMDCCYQKKAGVADLQVAVGWNLWRHEDIRAGFNIRAAAPTGNRPRAEYLFEPIVGNGRHWELGIGFSGDWTFWRSEDEERSCAFFCDANVTHLFKTMQCRTFDLKCKPMSRYMLAAKFDLPVRNLQSATDARLLDSIIPSKQFKAMYTPVANITTMTVDVSSSAQADLALMFQYVHNNWSLDLGYNLWGRSCEKIEPLCDCCCPFEDNTWGLKGDAFMYGFYDYQGEFVAVPLSATQSQATICKGTNTGHVDETPWYQNPGVDNRKLSWNSAGNPLLAFILAGLDGQVYTSREPVLINFCDLDIDGARTKGLSHKVFFHFDYTWKDRENWIPFLGFGGEVEFAHQKDSDCCSSCYNTCNPCDTSCGTCCGPCGTCCSPFDPCGSQYETCCCMNSCDCQYCAISQWGIWLKGGVAFH